MADISMDKKYRTRDWREVRLYCTDGGGNFPVHGAMRGENGVWHTRSWTSDGRNGAGGERLIEVGPYDHLKKGDRVLAWDVDDKRKVRGYFSGVDDYGYPHLFMRGATEWSSKGATVPFDYCEAWTEDAEQ